MNQVDIYNKTVTVDRERERSIVLKEKISYLQKDSVDERLTPALVKRMKKMSKDTEYLFQRRKWETFLNLQLNLKEFVIRKDRAILLRHENAALI